MLPLMSVARAACCPAGAATASEASVECRHHHHHRHPGGDDGSGACDCGRPHHLPLVEPRAIPPAGPVAVARAVVSADEADSDSVERARPRPRLALRPAVPRRHDRGAGACVSAAAPPRPVAVAAAAGLHPPGAAAAVPVSGRAAAIRGRVREAGAASDRGGARLSFVYRCAARIRRSSCP